MRNNKVRMQKKKDKNQSEKKLKKKYLIDVPWTLDLTVNTPIRIFLTSPVSNSPHEYFRPISFNSSSSSRKKLNLIQKKIDRIDAYYDCCGQNV